MSINKWHTVDSVYDEVQAADDGQAVYDDVMMGAELEYGSGRNKGNFSGGVEVVVVVEAAEVIEE